MKRMVKVKMGKVKVVVVTKVRTDRIYLYCASTKQLLLLLLRDPYQLITAGFSFLEMLEGAVIAA